MDDNPVYGIYYNSAGDKVDYGTSEVQDENTYYAQPWILNSHRMQNAKYALPWIAMLFEIDNTITGKDPKFW